MFFRDKGCKPKQNALFRFRLCSFLLKEDPDESAGLLGWSMHLSDAGPYSLEVVKDTCIPAVLQLGAHWNLHVR